MFQKTKFLRIQTAGAGNDRDLVTGISGFYIHSDLLSDESMQAVHANIHLD